MGKPTNPTRQRRHDRGLTLAQANAVELLAVGQSDTAVAETLSLARETVTRWRLYDPIFRAAVHRQRAAIWQGNIDRLRTLTGKALDALEAVLADASHPDRWKAAAQVLKQLHIGADDLAAGPQDPEKLVLNIVENRRHDARSPLTDSLDSMNGHLPFDRQVEQVWDELEAKAGIVDEPA